jgi:hypothetical protein
MNRVFVFLVATFAVVGTLPAIAQQNDKPRFLYVQNAQSMTLRNGTLTLKNVSPLTLFFSDRPKRIAGHMRTEDFIKHWNKGTNSFKASPPNATIAVFRDASHITDGIVELSEPKADGPNLSFKVKMLLGELPAEAKLCPVAWCKLWSPALA